MLLAILGSSIVGQLKYSIPFLSTYDSHSYNFHNGSIIANGFTSEKECNIIVPLTEPACGGCVVNDPEVYIVSYTGTPGNPPFIDLYFNPIFSFPGVCEINYTNWLCEDTSPCMVRKEIVFKPHDNGYYHNYRITRINDATVIGERSAGNSISDIINHEGCGLITTKYYRLIGLKDSNLVWEVIYKIVFGCTNCAFVPPQ